jgi:hypothetical protein
LKTKKIWGPNTPWKTESAWWGYLRGCLRKAWSRNPIKLNLLKSKRKQIPNPNPRGKKDTVWGFDCPLCDNTYVMADGEVDHIVGAGSLKSVDDIQGFVERLLFVTEDDLRLICKPCHRAITYAEKSGMSFDDAKVEKEAIRICAEGVDKEWLVEHNQVPASSKAKRREQIITYLKENNDQN